jgi:hypothetical protein
MATEHNDQSPSASEKKQGDFEIEDIGLEEATGGSCSSCTGCGGVCAGKPPALDQSGG